VSETTPELSANHARVLGALKEQCGLFYVLPGANAFGAALCGGSGERSFMDILEGIESGAISGLLVVESDPFYHFPDQQRLEKAVNKLQLLIVLDCLPSGVAQRAHVLLPTLNPFETGSTFINQEGRIQFAQPVHAGGVPLCQESRGGHPPRIFREEIPGRDQKAPWQALADLAAVASPESGNLWEDGPSGWIAQVNPLFSVFKEKGYPLDGVRVLGPRSDAKAFGSMEAVSSENPPPDLLELLMVEWTFSTEEFSAYSHVIQQVEKDPFACMHPEDAAGAGLSDGDRISVPLDNGCLQMRLSVTDKMARGALIVPRHRQIPWQKFKGSSTTVPLARIAKG
jgi:hypothetical protein